MCQMDQYNICISLVFLHGQRMIKTEGYADNKHQEIKHLKLKGRGGGGGGSFTYKYAHLSTTVIVTSTSNGKTKWKSMAFMVLCWLSECVGKELSWEVRMREFISFQNSCSVIHLSPLPPPPKKKTNSGKSRIIACNVGSGNESMKVFRVYFGSTYFAKIENFLPKIL